MKKILKGLSDLLTPQPTGDESEESLKGQKYWQEQGWKLGTGRLDGYYRTKFGSYKGYIKLFLSGKHLYHIYDPPVEIRFHSHWPCFVAKGGGMYWIHFDIEANCVDTGILTIEKIIREARYNHQLKQSQ